MIKHHRKSGKRSILGVISLLLLGFFTLTYAALEDSKTFPANPEKNLNKTQIDSYYYPGTSAYDYMEDWAILGPIQLKEDFVLEDVELLKPFFNKDFLKSYGGEHNLEAKPDISYNIGKNRYSWQLFEAKNRVVDLTKIFGRLEGAITYAYAEINSPYNRKVLFDISSNDAIKVWINGELVHENWVFRSANIDNADLVEANLYKGRNKILLKVMNGHNTWGFLSTILTSSSLNWHLRMEVRARKLDKIKKLVENGADINSTGREQATPLHFAKIKGNQDIIAYLISQGADDKIAFPPEKNLIDRLLGRGTRSGAKPGAAVLVAQDGEIVFQKGYGYPDLKSYKKITPQTKFRIGSITKQFTATAILLLQEQGKLSVNDPLSKFIPDYPRGNEVTLHHLLTHTSGIRNYTNKPEFWKIVTGYNTPEEMIEFFKHDAFDFNPGEKWSYSNSGYFLLGNIIAKASGQSYSDYLREHIFEPFGMDNSGIYNSKIKLKKEAIGYSYKGRKIERALNWDMSTAYAAGAIYSTVADLHRWNEAVFNSKVLNETSLKAAFTPVPQDGRKPVDNILSLEDEGYGYGWGISKHRGLKLISHSGGLDGFQSQLSRYPDQNLTIVVLGNASPAHRYTQPSRLAKRIAEFYLWDKMDSNEIPKTISTVDPKVYKAYVGQYDFSGHGNITITLKDHILMGQFTGQKKVKLQPLNDSQFFIKEFNAQLNFIKDKDGNVNEMILMMYDRRQVARRMEEKKIVGVNPSIYKAYVGDYDYGRERILTVTIKDDRLFAKMTKQSKHEIFPKSNEEFFWKAVNAQIKFVKNDKGEVIKAIHHQGNHYLEVKKIR